MDTQRTLGSPIMIRVPNKDQKSKDYAQVGCQAPTVLGSALKLADMGISGPAFVMKCQLQPLPAPPCTAQNAFEKLCLSVHVWHTFEQMEVAYRPSHADATYDFKYGIRAVAGGGRSSARETIGRVAAGAVAKKLLAQLCPGIEVGACSTDCNC